MVGETGTIEEKLDRVLRAISLAGERHVELDQRITGLLDRVADLEEAAAESTSTLCNGKGETGRARQKTIRQCLADAAELEGLRNIVGDHPGPESEFEAEVLAHAAVRDAADATWSPPTFIQSERDHYTPPSPAFDPQAASETCAHSGCRRRAFASLSNIEGDKWLACAEHYEQDLASQARAEGHEPAWRVPIGPGVVLERWRGGPIGVRVDGELRCYVTAGELARIFEGPVS